MAVLSLALLLLGMVLTSADQVSVPLLPESEAIESWPPQQQVREGPRTFNNVDAPTAARVKSALTPHTHAFTLLRKKCKTRLVLLRFTSGWSCCRTPLPQGYDFLLWLVPHLTSFSLLLQAGEVDRKGKSCQFYFYFFWGGGGRGVHAESWGFPPDTG